MTRALPFLLLIFAASSCVSFKHEWGAATSQPTQSLESLEIKAQELEASANTKVELQELLQTYKELASVRSDKYFPLWKAGNYHILYGAYFAESKKEKKMHYREAIKYCEKAMYTNEDFAAKVDAGVSIPDAVSVLTMKEIDAMGFWYTARFYFFKEAMSAVKRAFNTNIILENSVVMDRIDQLDSEWQGGGNYFSRAIYYIATPERFGGSKAKADEEFTKAIQIGPNYYVNRWGRAKYLYSLTGNTEAYIADLEWIIAQDPKEGENPYAWNMYFIDTAREMLAAVR